MTTHADYRGPGVISLFLGRLRSEGRMDEYLTRRFETDFGFAIDPRDAPEFFCSKSPSPVRELLRGFSSEASFADDASEGASRSGWSEANCALVFYNFAYKATAAAKSGDLTFIGVFPLRAFE